MRRGLLVSQPFLVEFGEELEAVARGCGLELDLVVLPQDPAARLGSEDLARIHLAFFSADIIPQYSRGFFAAAQGAPNLQWLHVFNAGVDEPVFRRILDKGARLTNSSGSSADPIAQTAIMGLLMLARGVPHWLDAQRRHAWEPIQRAQSPPDLRGQVMVLVGVGAIGREIARLAQALGLIVVGVRRSPRRPDDPVDEMHPPGALHSLLPRADWVALACPLTEETRGLISTREIELLPRGARIINISRGEVIDEPALIDALRSGRLGGAYLDVFVTEPLQPESPLWDFPNVIVTPHNSAVAKGNERRAAEIFFRNLRAWAKEEPLDNAINRE
jgi:D-2-hydroxyacid dehydrogenase (NADP+)